MPIPSNTATLIYSIYNIDENSIVKSKPNYLDSFNIHTGTEESVVQNTDGTITVSATNTTSSIREFIVGTFYYNNTYLNTEFKLSGCGNNAGNNTYYLQLKYKNPQNETVVIATNYMADAKEEDTSIFSIRDESIVNQQMDLYVVINPGIEISDEILTPLIKTTDSYNLSSMFERPTSEDYWEYQYETILEDKQAEDLFNMYVSLAQNVPTAITVETADNRYTIYSNREKINYFREQNFQPPLIAWHTSTSWGSDIQYEKYPEYSKYQHNVVLTLDKNSKKLLLTWYNNFIETTPSSTDVIFTRMYYSMGKNENLMITDRTMQDVNKVKELNEKLRLGTLTEQERISWVRMNYKGALNTSDLSRIKEGITKVLKYCGIRTQSTPESLVNGKYVSFRSISSKGMFKIRFEDEVSYEHDISNMQYVWASHGATTLERTASVSLAFWVDTSQIYGIDTNVELSITSNGRTIQIPIGAAPKRYYLPTTYNSSLTPANYIYLNVNFPNLSAPPEDIFGKEILFKIEGNPSTLDTTATDKVLDNVETNYTDFSELDYYLNYVNNVIDYTASLDSDKKSIPLPSHDYNHYEKWNTIESILDNAYDVLTEEIGFTTPYSPKVEFEYTLFPNNELLPSNTLYPGFEEED